jgi:hypothetical protein
MMLLTAMAVQAQIVIGGSIYGGGNAGNTGGSTKVTVYEGDLHAVFAGARMADVGGSAFVHIDGEHASDYIVADYVYGGNDIAGTIGTSNTLPVDENKQTILTKTAENNIDNTWNAFVRISSKTTTGDELPNDAKIYIGQLFGGGNGYYDYRTTTDETGTIYTVEDKHKTTDKVVATSKTPLTAPELGKTYLEILGGSIVYAYGGGNNATVTDTTVICLDNPSKVVNTIKDTNNPNADNTGELLTNNRFKVKMRINTGFSYPSSGDYQIGRLFGGNNKAKMAIRPVWRLKRGKVRNIYSGGNEGAMTSKSGILLALTSADMEIDNVYGGCRMADVNPDKSTIAAETIEGNFFPANYAARVLVTAGNINNVYGGNDVTGNVYGGNAVGIHSSIKGDVYGGGNGSYPYTDKEAYKNDTIYSDIYYNPGANSLDSLKAFRPNAESVSIRVVGTADKPTVIGGALYCGGNSATLHNDDSTKDAAAELKIGSYVIADKVFLGNNGANMVMTNEEETDATTGEVIKREGILRTMETVNSINLKDSANFDRYMDAIAMDIKPRVVFDDVGVYEPYSTKFGSFYCGGNVGSMKFNGAMTLNFNDKVIIYNKVVGGSNEANVYQSDYNAQYLGGLLGNPDANGNKLILNFGGLKIQPMRWKIKRKADYTPQYDSDGNEQYELDENGNRILEWNTVDGSTFDTTTKTYTAMEPVAPTAEGAEPEAYNAAKDLKRRFHGGNIYGGCYNNGHVNGNVIINLNASLVDRKGKNAIFDEIEEEEGEAKLYNNEDYTILKRNTGVLLDEQGMDVLGRALNVFGGGYGGDSEIWGSTTINLNAGYTFQIFGGGEQGAIGNAISHKPDANDPTIHNLEYKYDEKYSTYINVNGGSAGTYRGDKADGDGVVDNDDMAEAEFIYGGSFEGPIAGSTHINLGNGRIFNSFAGSCNADILGHTETYIGRQVSPNFRDKMPANVNNDNAYTNGFPWVRDHVYGGNDLGGRILNKKNFIGRVNTDIQDKVHNPKGLKDTDDNPTPEVTEAAAYMEYVQGRVENIFGGAYGVYDYTDPHFKNYTYTRTGKGTTDDPYVYTNDGSNADNVGKVKGNFTKPRMDNAFINFKPNNENRNDVAKIFGAGQGIKDELDKDLMQQRSYVLIDAPGNLSNFQNMEVFGAGSYGGLGMNLTKAEAKADLDKVSAVIDLLRGKIANVYGGSWNEGMTRRTVVNVPVGSTVNVANLFGGAFGTDPLIPCDVYEAKVNYHSEAATVRGNIYGGNNHADRTLYGQVNISAPVWQNKAGGYLATVYGAGYGEESWSQYTEVNLTDSARVYEVYGGGENGQVLNLKTINEWEKEEEEKGSYLDLTIGSDYVDYGLDIPEDDPDAYLVKPNGLGTKTNTNVYIGKGVLVGYVTYKDDAQHPDGRQKVIYGGYAFGGGKGSQAIVSGTTYIGLHGGEVCKDLYGGGYGGSVLDDKGAKNFTARTNAYIEGGTLRKVFGGGYEGHVGKHTGATVDGKYVAVAGSLMDDIPGETNVVIGIRKDQVFPADFVYDNAEKGDSLNYYKGIPVIQWNAYGAGEGGSVFGTSHLTMNNGYIGYDYKGIVAGKEVYEPKFNNETVAGTGGVGQLKDYGSVFGAGYDDKSSSDFTNIKIYGGLIRGSLYGGGEIATVGRGRTGNLTGLDRNVTDMYLIGGTHIEMYNGQVQRNVFGGGKGYNLYGYGGSNELYTDGYVFGKTEVYIHGGEVGTVDGLADGYGNVFGGGDVGFLYGAGYLDQQTKNEKDTYKNGSTGSPNHWYYYASYKCKTAYGPYKVGDVVSDKAYSNMSDEEKAYWESGKYLTEDCRVVVAPYLQVKPEKSVTYGKDVNNNDVVYQAFDYVPTDYLNTLKSKDTDARWKNLFCGDGTATVNTDDQEERGIHIFNGVFGGGNVSSNSDQTYANATTVFGNTTATLYDVYHRDFITVGTEHTGGLYGGGNLSVVDGYRELNITNYGTDYYGLDTQISLTAYRDSLTNRERAYFQLEYLCNTTYTVGDKTYTKDVSRISEEEYDALPSGEKSKWDQYGFCSIYAGRLLNTIQRAELCGVFGSRMVLQGAVDRVADIGDKTEYTINRIGELSLNKQKSIAGDTGDKAEHGNYFGIYSVVNYLGNLTSDVKFTDNYLKWNNTDKKGEEVDRTAEEKYTYYNWKVDHLKKRDRNNGTCHNQVALASGVFLELTTENSTQTKKDYGYITGIVELDLINVKKDIEGGGYVYAKNEHGERTELTDHTNIILSSYNKENSAAGREYEARTYKFYSYYQYDEDKADDNAAKIMDMETSGNFIHKTKRIVDDCFPNNGAYRDGYVASPAHYWYIKGEVYIYDQILSAYAGSATAYSKEVKIPLTITAGSDGKLQLLNVQPNLYAYYTSSTDRTEAYKIGKEGVKVNQESEVYQLNEVITWWDWYQLSSNEQKYFVKETCVNVDTCYVDGKLYPAGTYVLENDPTIHDNDASQTAYKLFKAGSHSITSLRGTTLTVDDVFHPSNNISHGNGYVLTFEMDSPKDWDKWYSPVSGNSTYTGTEATTTRKSREEYKALSDSEKNGYREGPTFKLTGDNGLYGQRNYSEGEIIAKEVYTDYTTTTATMLATMSEEEKAEWKETQAEVEPAYVALADIGATQKGSGIPKSVFDGLTDQSNYKPAMVCTSSIRLGEEEYLLQGELVSAEVSNLQALAVKYMTYNNSLTNIEDITEAEALAYINEHLSEAYYCKTEGLYGGQYFQQGTNYGAIKAWCALTDDRDKFTFNYDALDVLSAPTYPGEGHTAVYDGNGVNSPLYSAVKPVEYSAVNNNTTPITYYYEGENETTATAKTVAPGASITRSEYERIKNEKKHYTRIDVKAKTADSETLTVYIATENFTDHGTPYGEGQNISQKDYNNLKEENQSKTIEVTFTRGTSDEVKYYCYKGYGNVIVGTIITASEYGNLKNYQENFTIQGSEPTETTTLYVSRESNAKDVTSEKVISVVYQYTYYEADDEGEGISLVNELHVVNIHLQLESGAPEIGPLSPPATVLPGDWLRLKAPSVNPGLYEVIANGWEMFSDENDAYMHRNGVPFNNNSTPVYWYQNEKRWVAFYSKTYLGKTYSDPVLVTVANYHDLSDVMADKEHHMYIDHEDLAQPGVRNPKIYLNQDKHQGENQLDLLKSFFNLSTGADLEGHAALRTEQVGNSKNLDFILKSNLDHSGSEWTSIGSDANCFEGTLHGDGYTVKGLDNSLFYKLCGEVYNLGVTGSFTGAGVVEKGDGYVENCWISTSSKEAKTAKPVFGEPSTTDETKPIQIVNSYYFENDDAVNKYTNHDANSTYGTTTRMDSTAFYNGTVAYNLNGFYLNKRYYDGKGETTTNTYPYLYTDKTSGVLTEGTGYYPVSPNAKYGDVGYVESRYGNIDFIYADGKIPEAADDRQRTKSENNIITTYFAPIWPTDYQFFGQTLTYGYGEKSHEDLPGHISSTNRVMRAPAYFRNNTMGMAHFNAEAIIPAKSKPKTVTDTKLKDAYPNMTAIDFAGHEEGTAAAAYKQGYNGNLFYQPLLDDDGLGNIHTNGQTQNLLVYAPLGAANENQPTTVVNKKTYDVLNAYYTTEPPYANYNETSNKYAGVDKYDYNRVASASAEVGTVVGHLVQATLTNDMPTATNDHLLVDKQDFFCPIAYTFDDNSRMWYQRTPDNYVDRQSGWETISLPFEAEVVTTDKKGELTHFYGNSTKGHEYWLREYNGKESEANNVMTAKFERLAAETGSNTDKTVNNTFLWDYFYEGLHNQQDDNLDEYQVYYKDSREYPKYPRMKAGTPYLIGFPGQTYYEFDLSGNFKAITTSSGNPDTLTVSRQVLSFISNPGITVKASDEETGTSKDNYLFKTNYLRQSLTGNNWALNAKNNESKSSFDKTPASATTETPAVNVWPFRPYFTTPTAGAPKHAASRINISSNNSSFGIDDDTEQEDKVAENLIVKTRRGKIIVISQLRHERDIRIVNVSGVTVAAFTIQPGETVETRVNVAGVYIVNNKKLAVR